MMTDPGQIETTGFLDFRRPNAARSFVFLGIGMALGLTIAGVGLFTARGTSTLVIPPEDVASVNQRPISRVDFNAQLQALYAVSPSEATPQQRRKVLDDMIREELFVQRGLELDVAATDPAARAALVAAVEQQIMADVLTRQPATAELQTYYQQHQSAYQSEGTMIVRDLVGESRQQADTAVLALRAGEPAAAVATRLGLHESGKVRGEEFYFAAEIHMGEALFAVAKGLTDGAVSEPIALPDGQHVLMMIKNAKPTPVDFATAYEQVLGDWRRNSSARLLAGDETFLRKRANILIAEDQR